jgi:hypothetical protein
MADFESGVLNLQKTLTREWVLAGFCYGKLAELLMCYEARRKLRKILLVILFVLIGICISCSIVYFIFTWFSTNTKGFFETITVTKFY